MATDSDTGQQVDAPDVSRALGRLEGRMDGVRGVCWKSVTLYATSIGGLTSCSTLS